MKKISVIIAAFNEDIYIERAIKSIQNQLYQNLEIIVCDDCSSDNTVEVVEKLKKNDNRIILIKNEYNIKSAATRNKCLDIATGDYIAIQDADDYSHPRRLLEQINFLERNLEYDFVSSGMFRFDDDGIYSISYPNKLSPKKIDFLKGTPHAHAPTMFRKNVLKSIGGYRVSKETVRGEDSDLFMRLYYNNKKGYNLNEALYYYNEGIEAYSRKKFRYRIDSVVIKYKGFKNLGLLPKGYIYLLKPIFIGLIPNKLMLLYKKQNKHKIAKSYKSFEDRKKDL